jgi:hypothetical protein
MSQACFIQSKNLPPSPAPAYSKARIPLRESSGKLKVRLYPFVLDLAKGTSVTSLLRGKDSMFNFDLPQFTTQEMLSCIPGLNHETFKQWLKRRVVLLSVGENIGSGRRPLYRGSDVVQVAAIFELARQGLLVSKAKFICDVVRGRVIAKQTGLAAHVPNKIVCFFYLHPVSGDLMASTLSEDEEPDRNPLELADVQVVFAVDRFIDRIVGRMERLKAGQSVLEHIEPAPKDEYGDFMRIWDFDADGNKVLVGLTRAETEWYQEFNEKNIKRRSDQNFFPWSSVEEHSAENDAWIKLNEQHEKARLQRIFSENTS